MKSVIKYVLIIWTAIFLNGCGGGDSAPGVSVASLQGTWYGALWEGTYYLEASITFDNAGKITSFSWGGEPQDTGTTKLDQGRVFAYAMTKDSGALLLDNTGQYLAFASDNIGDIGFFQKDGSGYPADFRDADIIAKWSGYSVSLTFDAEIDQLFTSSADVSGGSPGVNYGTFVASDSLGGDSTGVFLNYHQTVGLWLGEGNTVGEGAFELLVWLSADKKAAFTIGCDPGAMYNDPVVGKVYIIDFTGCSYTVWNKG